MRRNLSRSEGYGALMLLTITLLLVWALASAGRADITGTGSMVGSNVTQIGGASLALGQAASSASLPVSIANDEIYGQNSTTSGQVGFLSQGAVTTAAPSYTNAKTDPLSMTTGGGLRIDLASCGATAVALGQTTKSASIPITLPSDVGTLTTANNAIATGGYSYAKVASLAGQIVKGSSGWLHTVTINTKGASSNVLTLYDNATTNSGTAIATIDTTAAVTTLTLDVQVTNGIYALDATGTAPDATITYK